MRLIFAAAAAATAIAHKSEFSLESDGTQKVSTEYLQELRDGGQAAIATYLVSPFLYPIKCRELLPVAFARMGLTGVGVEVGVLRGDFSKLILQEWPGHLVLVDPWMKQVSPDYVDINNSPQDEQDANMEATRQQVAPYIAQGRLVTFVRDFSVNAAARFPNASIDWVYLDGNHHYEAVRDDIQAWWPKIKEGGVLSGHDWVDDGFYGTAGVFGVQRAVLEFALRERKQILTTYGEYSPVYMDGSMCITEPVSWYTRK